MIVQSLSRAGWPVLLAFVSVVACSKKVGTQDAYVNASLSPSGGDTNLCPLGPGTQVLAVGAMESTGEPMTTPEGQEGLNVDCTVSPNGGGFDIRLSASKPGATGGNLIVTGHVDGSTGGTVNAQFVSGPAAAGYSATNDCTLSYMYMGQKAPIAAPISAGQIFAHVSCPNAEINNGAVAGQQIPLPDGGVANATCDGEADFLFSNCAE